MLETEQMKKDKKVTKRAEAEYYLYGIGVAAILIATLLMAIIAAMTGQATGWGIWLQLVAAGIVFAFALSADRLQLDNRAWLIGATICAIFVFCTSIFSGIFLNVLLAPLIVGAGLRSQNQYLILRLTLATISLILVERIAFAIITWNGIDNGPSQSTISAIIAISTVGLTVSTFLRNYRKRIALLEQEQESNASEMVIAHEIQTSLMAPSEIETGNWSMAARSIPAKDVGGDFYDYIPYLDRGIGGIAIGDVAGKGIPAALQMAVVRTLFRVEARRRIFPGETLNSVNAALQAERSFGMVTMLYAFVDPANSTLHLSNAGHNYPVVLNGNGTFEEMKLPGLPLGIDDDIEYEEKVIKIKPGTSVVFYTDGVVEAMSSDNEMYGFERMRRAMLMHQKLEPRLMVDQLMADVATFTGGAPQSDDITIVVLQHHPSAVGDYEPDEPEEGADGRLEASAVSAGVVGSSNRSSANIEDDDGINWL